MNKKQIAAIYIRVSTDAQAEEGYSIDAQKEQLSAYCVAKGIKNYEFYIDGGWSGSNIDRPEITRLIKDVKEHKISHCLVYKLDRLSRSQKDTLYLIEDVFNPYGVAFISLTEQLDTSSAMGRAMIGILSAFAQLERENIRMRTRMGMLERVKSGFWMGGGRVPFGYDYDSAQGILVPNKDAKKVQQIYDYYLNGMSCQKIADILDLKYDRLVIQILKRKSNLGIIEFRGCEYPGKHQAIISEETYYKAMELMKEKSERNIRTTDNSNLLTGLVYCGKCGAKMRYQKWGKKGQKLICYSQQTSKKYLIKDENCNQEKFWACDIEDEVIKNLFEFSLKLKNKDLANNTPYETTEDVIQREIDETNKRIKKLFNLYASENNDEILFDVINENKAKLVRLQEQLKVESKLNVRLKIKNQTLETLRNLLELWDTMPLEKKQFLLRSVINKVIITGDKVTVEYKV